MVRREGVDMKTLTVQYSACSADALLLFSAMARGWEEERQRVQYSPVRYVDSSLVSSRSLPIVPNVTVSGSPWSGFAVPTMHQASSPRATRLFSLSHQTKFLHTTHSPSLADVILTTALAVITSKQEEDVCICRPLISCCILLASPQPRHGESARGGHWSPVAPS